MYWQCKCRMNDVATQMKELCRSMRLDSFIWTKTLFLSFSPLLLAHDTALLSRKWDVRPHRYSLWSKIFIYNFRRRDRKRDRDREESRRNELESAIQLESFPRSTSVRKISKRCDVWRFHDLRQSSCHAYLWYSETYPYIVAAVHVMSVRTTRWMLLECGETMMVKRGRFLPVVTCHKMDLSEHC